MPQTEVRPNIALNLPSDAAKGSMEKPIRVNSAKMTISWRPYPKADKYKVLVFEGQSYHAEHGELSGAFRSTEIHASSQNPSRLGLPISQTHISLDFFGLDPVFNRTYSYNLMVEALDRNGETLSTSDDYYFQPANALAPQPLTNAAFAQALGPGFKVMSIQLQKDKVVVNAIMPTNFQWSRAAIDAISSSGSCFGLENLGWITEPRLNTGAGNAAQSMQLTYSRNNLVEP